jgi:hypothetical protein
MDPRVLMFLSNTEGMTPHEVEMNNALIKLYMGGFVEAKWENGEPLFSLGVSKEEAERLMYAHSQAVIEE